MVATSIPPCDPVSASVSGSAYAPDSALDLALGSSTPIDVMAPAPAAPRTRLQAGICKPKVYSDGTVRYACSTTYGEPHSLQKALSTPS
jgi:hypothetical protein